MRDLLRPVADVRLWSQYDPAPEIAAAVEIHRIDPRRLCFPRSGVFLFVGSYYPFGRWVALTRPNRIIVLYNTHDAELLEQNLARFRWPHLPAVEVLYASDEIAAAASRPGLVELSPIDLRRFASRKPLGRDDATFTVGRLSRDSPMKHDERDIEMYRRFTSIGYRVRIMGGASLIPKFEPALLTGNLEIVPTLSEDPVDFLRSLDCFYYRTAASWPEPYGRVVFEAMACGVPVVAHRSGGYARYIEHGVSGFLFDDEREASEYIAALSEDPALRTRLGAAARRTVERMYGELYERSIRDFYVR